MRSHAVSDLALLLAGDPEPDVVADHLSTITFADHDPVAITLYIRDVLPNDDQLLMIGQHGLSSPEQSRYGRIRTDFPLPAAEAMRHSLPFSRTVGELAVLFPVLRIREDFFDRGSHLTIPITVDGVTVGATMVTCATTFTWDPDTWHTVLAIQALLGFYVRLSEAARHSAHDGSPGGSTLQGLTDRQVAILEFIRVGKSTSAIAARLGFSDSTIKQDIRRIMSILAVRTRQQAVVRAEKLGLIPRA